MKGIPAKFWLNPLESTAHGNTVGTASHELVNPLNAYQASYASMKSITAPKKFEIKNIFGMADWGLIG